jgi:hypothetical protein
MKNKLFLAVALIGLATFSAQARICFGISLGIPLPVPIAVTTPVVSVVAAPVVIAPPVVVAAPVDPSVGYVWAPGYWSMCGYDRVWVPGCWRSRPVYVGCGYPCGWRRW